jgi:hypothetical protein
VAYASRSEEIGKFDAGGECKVHVAVLTGVTADGVPRAGLAVADALDDVASLGPHGGGVLVERGESIEVCHLDSLAASLAVTGPEGGNGTDIGVDTGLEEGVEAGAANGLSVSLTVDVEVAADSVIGEAVGAELAVGAEAPEGRDLGANEVLMATLRDARGGDEGERIWRRAFDQDVGGGEEFVKLPARWFIVEIELESSFRGVEVGIGGADAVPVFAFVEIGCTLAGFDTEDGGAIIGKELGGVGTGSGTGDFDNTEVLEALHRGPSLM